jgi:hypothetical protein
MSKKDHEELLGIRHPALGFGIWHSAFGIDASLSSSE